MGTYHKTINFSLIMYILMGTIISGTMGYDYYWRDYDGENIPADALEVVNGSNAYIGQVYIHNRGLFVGTIYKGQDYVEVSAYGYTKTNKLIKILCTDIDPTSPPGNLWYTTSHENFHVDIIEKNPIIGGYDYFHQGYMNIGRVQDGNSLVVGSINSFANDVYLYYANQNHEHKAIAFQVLCDPPS